MIESFTLLGALATVTQRVELGTMVANVWNRQVGTLLSAAGSVARVAGRQFHLGIGAGASPTSRWAIEQHAVGAHVEASLRERHDRVRQVLELSARMWHSDPAPELATFPAPTPPPTRIVGVNSVALSRLAGECADGINLPWRHPRRDEFLAAVNAVVGDRPFVRTVYTVYDDALLDPDHRDRRLMRERDIDRAGAGPVRSAPAPHLTRSARYRAVGSPRDIEVRVASDVSQNPVRESRRHGQWRRRRRSNQPRAISQAPRPVGRGNAGKQAVKRPARRRGKPTSWVKLSGTDDSGGTKSARIRRHRVHFSQRTPRP